jgi:hypothetical protein
VGALLGGFLASALLKIPDAVNGINVMSSLVAFIGAVIQIALLRAVPGRRRLIQDYFMEVDHGKEEWTYEAQCTQGDHFLDRRSARAPRGNRSIGAHRIPGGIRVVARRCRLRSPGVG